MNEECVCLSMKEREKRMHRHPYLSPHLPMPLHLRTLMTGTHRGGIASLPVSIHYSTCLVGSIDLPLRIPQSDCSSFLMDFSPSTPPPPLFSFLASAVNQFPVVNRDRVISTHLPLRETRKDVYPAPLSLPLSDVQPFPHLLSLSTGGKCGLASH